MAAMQAARVAKTGTACARTQAASAGSAVSPGATSAARMPARRPACRSLSRSPIIQQAAGSSANWSMHSRMKRGEGLR